MGSSGSRGTCTGAPGTSPRARARRTLSSAFTSSAVVGRATSKTQSVMDALVRGTRTARPLSLPCQCDCV